MKELLIEFIGDVFLRFISRGFTYLGAAIRWLFLKNKYNYNEIVEWEWNTTIGFFISIGLIFLLIYIFV